MMKKALLIMLLLLPVPVYTGEPAVTVAMVEGSADGLVSRMVVEEAYRRLGVDVEFKPYSAASALEASNGGEVSAELARIDGIGLEYGNLVKIPIPVNLIQGTAFSRQYRFPVTGWHSLRPYKIGIVRGIIFSERQTTGMDREVFDQFSDLINALDNGSIDVGIMPRIQGLYTMLAMGIDDITEMEGILETLFLYHYVHVDHQDLADQLTPVLKKMSLNGEIRRIRDEALETMLGPRWRARLQPPPTTQGILVSSETHLLVRDALVTEPAEPIVAKGFEKPAAVYKVTGKKD